MDEGRRLDHVVRCVLRYVSLFPPSLGQPDDSAAAAMTIAAAYRPDPDKVFDARVVSAYRCLSAGPRTAGGP
jgi:hypothetical protein